jgi:hypothetical protein
LAEKDRMIRSLEKAGPLKQSGVSVPVPQVKTVEVKVVTPEQLRRAEAVHGKVEKAVAGLATMLSDAKAASADLAGALRSAQNGQRTPFGKSEMERRPPITVATVARVKGMAAPRGDLTGPEQRILDAVAWLENVGVPQPENGAVAFMAGYRPNGGAFQNPRGRLNQQGLITYPVAGFVSLTEAGRALARFPDAPGTTADLHAQVLSRLDGPMRRILDPLLAAYPDPVANEDLAAAAGYEPNGGAYQNPKGRLRTLGLIDYPRPGHVVARHILFLDGR